MQKTVERLEGIVGGEHLVVQPMEMRAHLDGDETPCALVFPGSTKEVADTVALCNELGVKLAVGGRTVDCRGLAGGVAMTLSRLNRVLEIDHENLVAEVEAGASHLEFQQRLAAEGLCFPPEPYRGRGSTLGACIAAGDLDSKAFQYGPPRTYMLGFEMVLPTGEVVSCGNKVIKNVSGYDLIHFVVGSRGALGVITKVLLKLLPLPERRCSVLGVFPSLTQAAQVARTLLERRIYPARLNLLSAPLAARLAPNGRALAAGALVVVDLEGFARSTEQLAEEVAALFRLKHAGEIAVLDGDDAIDGLYGQWLDLKEACHDPAQERSVDFLVGPANLVPALGGLSGLVDDLDGADVLVYALNGNLRLFPPQPGTLASLRDGVNRLALSLGGNISGELGFRLKCEAQREMEMWREMTALTGTLRSQFDPRGILAPGLNLQPAGTGGAPC